MNAAAYVFVLVVSITSGAPATTFRVHSAEPMNVARCEVAARVMTERIIARAKAAKFKASVTRQCVPTPVVTS